MEEFKRNKITIISGLLVMILSCLLTYSLANKSRDDYDIKVKIDSKVDKVEYDKHCLENTSLFRELTVKQDVQLTKINETLQIILQQNTENRTDIAWIKKEIKR